MGKKLEVNLLFSILSVFSQWKGMVPFKEKNRQLYRTLEKRYILLSVFQICSHVSNFCFLCWRMHNSSLQTRILLSVPVAFALAGVLFRFAILGSRVELPSLVNNLVITGTSMGKVNSKIFELGRLKFLKILHIFQELESLKEQKVFDITPTHLLWTAF